MTRLVVVIDSPVHVADALAAAREEGARIVESWNGGVGDVCRERVSTPEDAAAALLAVVASAGLVVSAPASDELTDRFCDDLRRLGRLEILRASSSDARAAATHRRPSSRGREGGARRGDDGGGDRRLHATLEH